MSGFLFDLQVTQIVYSSCSSARKYRLIILNRFLVSKKTSDKGSIFCTGLWIDERVKLSWHWCALK